jgi:hypothetical protein
MKLETRLQKASKLLKEFLPLIDQWDKNVIENYGGRFEHPWITEVMTFSDDEMTRFDAKREASLLSIDSWNKTFSLIEEVCHFPSIDIIESNITTLGKKKKQHELNSLYSLLKSDKGNETKAVDFGGGVGNLAYFLEKEIGMDPLVLERDSDLVTSGKLKLSKLDSKVNFITCDVCEAEEIPELSKREFAIGLHTCGNFANHMLKHCAQSKVAKIVNFGCCYSKILENEYHLSTFADRSLNFNQRALLAATLSFGEVKTEFYEFRLRILKYKYSFYNWMTKKHGIMEFCAMSNSRRSLYDLSFYEFILKTLEKFYPDLQKPTELEMVEFFDSEENIALNKYFQSYFSLSRYFGQVLETYILCDRALFLQERGYNVEVKAVFEHEISPRNKAIIAELTS